MASRLFEILDPLPILERANIVRQKRRIASGATPSKVEEEENNPSTPASDVEQHAAEEDETLKKSIDYELLGEDAELRLIQGLQWSGVGSSSFAAKVKANIFISFADPLLEEGYLQFHTANHLAYLGTSTLGGIFFIPFWALGLANDEAGNALIMALRSLFLILLSIFCALRLLRGSCLRIKTRRGRARFHEVTTSFLIVVILSFDFIAFAAYSYIRCSPGSGWDKCNKGLLLTYVGNIAIGVLFAPRQRFAFLPLALYSIVYCAVPLYVPNPTLALNRKVSVLIFSLFGYHIAWAIVHAWESAQRVVYHHSLTLALKQIQAHDSFERAEAILTYLVPLSILKPLVNGEPVFHTKSASVVQADICNFTRWCQQRETSQEVVEMLSHVISGFDRLALANQVTRIKTLGDGYIAAAGVPDEQNPSDHAAHALKFALSLQVDLTRTCATHHRKCWGSLQVRTGVHSGQVSAGVLSRERWAYDIYGDTPRVAAILEPLAGHGEILISDVTLQLLGADHLLVKDRLERGPDLPAEEAGLEPGEGLLSTWRVMEVGLVDFSDEVLSVAVPSLGRGSESNEQLENPLGGAIALGETEPLEQQTEARALLFSRGALGGGLVHPGGGGRGNANQDYHPHEVVVINDSSRPQQQANDEDKVTPVVLLERNLVAKSTLVSFCFFTLSCVLLAIQLVDPINASMAAVLLLFASFLIFSIALLLPVEKIRLRTWLVCVACLGSTVLGVLTQQDAPLTLFVLPYNVMPYLHYGGTPSGSILRAAGVISIINLTEHALEVLFGYMTVPEAMYWTIFFIALYVLLKYIYQNRILKLKEETEEQDRQVALIHSQMKTIEFVLKLKMPDHVVERLFEFVQSSSSSSSGGGSSGTGIMTTTTTTQVLRSTYDLPSCHIVFCHFRIRPQASFKSHSPSSPVKEVGSGQQQEVTTSTRTTSSSLPKATLEELQFVTLLTDSLLAEDEGETAQEGGQSIKKQLLLGGINEDKVASLASPVLDSLMQLRGECLLNLAKARGIKQQRRSRVLEKVKSIGDTVMLGGSLVPSPSQREAEQEEEILVLCELLIFAQRLESALRERSQQLEENKGSLIQCFIGVHKGEVTTATIGEANLEYDVFGTTVNTAARVLSTMTAAGGGSGKVESVGVPGSSSPVNGSEGEGRSSPALEAEKGNVGKVVTLAATGPVLEVLSRLEKRRAAPSSSAAGDPDSVPSTPRSFVSSGETKFSAKGLREPLSRYFITDVEK